MKVQISVLRARTTEEILELLHNDYLSLYLVQ